MTLFLSVDNHWHYGGPLEKSYVQPMAKYNI